MKALLAATVIATGAALSATTSARVQTPSAADVDALLSRVPADAREELRRLVR